MNIRKALPLLVIASMMISLIPSAFFANAVLGVPAFTATTGNKGTLIKVTGVPTEVAAGTVVQIYWDDTTIAWDGTKGLMNSTAAKANGSYEVWFKVPEATKGNHYAWVKAVGTGELRSQQFVVTSKITLSPVSGLQGDHVTVTAYGLGGAKDARLFFLAGAQAFPAWTSAAGAAVTLSGDGVTKTFTGTVANTPIKSGTFTVTPPVLIPSDAMVDSSLGTLSSVAGGTGTINYITGAYSVTFNTAPVLGANNIAIAYNYYPTTAAQVYPLNQGATSSVGTYTATLTVPAGAAAGANKIAALDAVGNEIDGAFNIGPVVTANTMVTTVGSIVTLTGRGFTPAKVIGLVNLPKLARAGFGPVNCWIRDMPLAGIVVDAQGRFRMDIVVPQGSEKKDDYTITVKTDDNAETAVINDFEITALAVVTVSPSFGPQGSTITVSGVSYTKIADTTIQVELCDAAGAPLAPAVIIGTVKTISDGTFSKTFSVPAQVDASYKIKAYNTAQSISDTVGFRIGSMFMQLSSTSGPTGKSVTITGSGFSPLKTWNATIGSKTLVSTADAGAVAATGLISKLTAIPSLAPGVYTVTVWDIDADIKLTTTFEVTYNTQITLTPSTAANGFNVSVTGKGFKYASASISFLLYNKTSTGLADTWWNMDVRTTVTPGILATVNGTGFVTAWWTVPASTILSKGTYYVNATDADNYLAQATFEVGDKHIVIAPRKAAFKIGESISFQIEHTFGNVVPILGSTIKIYDPSNILVFSGDPLNTWIKVGEWYVAPYSSQTASGNSMTLPDDAVLGTWTFKWTDTTNKLVKEGSFTVEAAATSDTDAKIAALAAQITALASSVTSLGTTVGNVATQTGAATTAATAAKTAADAATVAATGAGTKADLATTAANAAKTAADAAAAAANNLTTLVYGAIGASLVAALAAIVALMQISRKIA